MSAFCPLSGRGEDRRQCPLVTQSRLGPRLRVAMQYAVGSACGEKN